MNKEQLFERINNLPEFEKRNVKIRTDAEADEDNGEYVKVVQKAICEIGDKDSKAYSFVSPNYTLVQFKDVFRPILQQFEGDLTGHIYSFGGQAIMKVFPEYEELKEGNQKFGLIALNSVDLSTSVIVKFCVQHKDFQFNVPAGVAGLKKNHTGELKSLVHDYISMIGKVKKIWKDIIEEFPKHHVVLDTEKTSAENALEFDVVCKKLGLGDRMRKKMKEKVLYAERQGTNLNLWNFCLGAIEEINQKTYKSGVHREKQIDKISKAIFEFDVLMKI